MSKQWGQAAYKRIDIASAATVNLSAISEAAVRITGTTTIAAITMRAWQRLYVTFADALTLAASIGTLPNGGNPIVTEAGDTAILTADGAGAVMMWIFQRAKGPDYVEGTFIPTFTFFVPGDLNVIYSVRLGIFTKIGRCVFWSINLVTSTFTHTTASGAATITGLPYTSANVTNQRFHGSLNFGGITKTGYTQFFPRVLENTAQVALVASGSGQAPTSVNAPDMPSGGSLNLRMDGMYMV